MTYAFGDGFDLYATGADVALGYWDAIVPTGFGSQISLGLGRFEVNPPGSGLPFSGQSANFNFAGMYIQKSSGVNDGLHHVCLAFRIVTSLGASNLGTYFSLMDGATAQCSVVFRSDGAIVFTSGGPTGSTLATFTGAVPVINIWNGFEFEIFIHPTVGSFKVRKNGNTVDDFSVVSINTRGGTANNYANGLQLGTSANVGNQYVDDFLWRSEASALAFLGDVRCYVRRPWTDVTAQFQRTGAVTINSGAGIGTGPLGDEARYTGIVLPLGGSIGSIIVPSAGSGSGINFKCAIFSDNAGAPGSLLATASNVVSSWTATSGGVTGTGGLRFTFSTPLVVAAGQTIWLGVSASASNATAYFYLNTGLSQAPYYPPNITYVSTADHNASWPPSAPSSLTTTGTMVTFWVTVTPINSGCVNENQQDAFATYVYDNNVNDFDLYTIAPLGVVPPKIFAVTTRGLVTKADVGSRSANMQMVSGAAQVASPTLSLPNNVWVWAWRTDINDPNTGALWTPTGVDALQIGPKVIA